jgi:acyl-CoA reductase-like NAD-dependent aldehyde dehydrogenase
MAEAVDAVIERLNERKSAWMQLAPEARILYLRRCIDGIVAVSQDWVEAACKAKGIPLSHPLVGEEWVVGPAAILTHLQQLIKALEAHGRPKPVSLRQQASGQVVAQVFPDNWMDRLLWLGFKGEVWLEPGKPATQGQFYRKPSHSGRLALVLGAGNISAIGALDALYQLFAEGAVVLLKLNPVNNYLRPFLSQAFAALRQDGFLAVISGDAAVGRYLCQHPAVDTIHITGSHHTHDAIVWGATPIEQAQRKATNQPLLQKPITSELGCVTPVMVVPGHWSISELKVQARHIASMVVHNASFNCVAAKVVITAKDWPQRSAFLAELQEALAQIPARTAYYPGAQERYQAFLDRYPQAEILGERTAQGVPWTFIPDVPAVTGEYALTTEAFCGILAEVSLPAEHAADFLAKVIPFVNESVWGSLSCMVFIDPHTQKHCKTDLEQAITQLRCGAIGINVWTGVIFQMGTTTWGAYPGNSLADIGSGRGMVHNAYLFDYPQKSVLYAPFHIFPTPIWFAGHRNLKQLAQRFTLLQAKSSLPKFVGVVLAALKG